MSTRKKPNNVVQRLLRRLWRSFNALANALLNWVLRSFRVHKRRSSQSQAGFVLPTVVMVLLVVALLTTAIVIRSFDRSKNASNYRVDQAVLNAATPALDRARAKIERLFSTQENRLSSKPALEGLNYDDQGTISSVLSQDEYTFGDETLLKVVYDIDGDKDIKKDEQIKTAWKFPIDTDNNGKFDSFTLYGIYFRNPAPGATRPRSPLEARARPQATGQSNACETAGNGGASDTQGWYETDGQLKKAFFTYVANVPIGQADKDKIPTAQQSKYEVYSGNKSFSALEMQQDQGQISLDNNAVWYNDDLVISNVPTFRLNGRIHTNSNLMVANNSSQEIVFYQVSSVDSCYYTAENSKIIVGGHVVAGDITGDTQGTAGDSTNDLVKIHLFKSPVAASSLAASTPPGPVESVNAGNKTTDFKPAEIATNSNAYETRLNALVNRALYTFDPAYPNNPVTDTKVNNVGLFPDEVKKNFASKYDKNNPESGASILKQVLNTYFAERLRRPSFKEVAANADPLTPPLSLGAFEAPVAWMLLNPANPADLPVKTASGGGIELEVSGDPSTLVTGRTQQELKIGDRIQVGNSLPRRWWQPTTSTYAKAKAEQDIPNASGRKRIGLVEQLDDLGDTSRGGYWERAAALSGKEFEQPAVKELAGGLRVVTGAGIYIDGKDPAAGGTGRRGIESFLPSPPTALELQQMAAADPGSIKLPKAIRDATPAVLADPNSLISVVWPDTMPMSEWKDNIVVNNLYDFSGDNREVKRGDLQMRATVVYHSALSSGSDQEPLACIATLYDPTSAKTAQNLSALPQDPDHQLTALPDDANAALKGLSINGLNYPATGLKSLRASAATNLTLIRQANMIFPDGRWVNKPLRDAVLKLATQGADKLDIANIAAIDAANCALQILKAPTAVSSSLVPNFAIKEEAFLDARQIKAIHKRNTIANSLGTLEPLKDVTGATVDFHQTKWESISNPDKLKIAELGELNLPDIKKLVPNYPFYSLAIEQRQPLEIRVTQIDLEQLKNTSVGTVNGKKDYLLPNSGIIYATRDDALPDISDFNPDTDGDKGSSPTDFLLDPTRRPNGILLVNGANLAREDQYRIEEKGLILATDLPVYIKSQKISGKPGGFNLHLKPGATAINDGTVREEFTELVDFTTYSNFYNRQARGGDGLNKNFACRKGQPGCTEGDQWRAARILSDAVTLLSSNFRFGYRNEGDFDLNNNIGNLAVESRLKNGFWWNAFATNGEWVDPANGYPKDFDAAGGIQGSTYVTNGVTPIQRRVKFPEYKMEICRKLPVAACGPGDWTKVGAGTTASTSATLPTDLIRYVKPEDRRYPRRVAFWRNDETGELIMPDACTADAPANCKATPIGVTASGGVAFVNYDGTTTGLPTAVDNALWFWTTGDPNDPSAVTGTKTNTKTDLTLPPKVSYNNTNKLYYAPFDPEDVSERQLLLPGLPEFPKVMGIPSLNTTDYTAPTKVGIAPSDYSMIAVTPGICAYTKDYKPSTNPLNLTACDTATFADTWTPISQAAQKLLNYPPDGPGVSTGVVKIDGTLKPLAPTFSTVVIPLTLKAEAKVNIYDLPSGGILSDVDITLDRNNRIDDPIFVFRAPSNLTIWKGVTLKLQGVDPNNIFWVIGKNLGIGANPPGSENKLAGNFINADPSATSNFISFNLYNPATGAQLPQAYSDQLAPLPKPIIQGGRILGFRTVPEIGLAKGAITAMTTTAQPLLIPVLNLHSPQGVPADNADTAFGGESINQDYWVQRVLNEVTETYNAVFIMGDSPSRPFTGIADPRYSGESGGGLGNFPRFLEAWQSPGPDSPNNAADVPKFNANTKISGSFIQFKRSIFATAPFEAIDDPKQDNSLFFDTATAGTNAGKPDYMSSFAFANPDRPYVYKGGGQLRKAPYYRAPNRAWGYDIGLLKQTPDLFSRRFSTPSAGTPNEYYREVSRDDLWVRTLMCAAEQAPAAAGGKPTYDQWAIADPKQRPSNCPDLSKYADPRS